LAKKEHNTFKVPLEIKELRGTDRKDRAAVEPVKFEPLRDNPSPPDYMGVVGTAEWHRILDQYKATKIFSVLDIPSIAIYCSAWDDYDRIKTGLMTGKYKEIATFENGTQQVTPYMTLLQRAVDTIRVYGERLGVTPVSRTKVSGLIGKPKEEDTFGAMFDKKKAQ
jgi:P27 family predicted phage terminase small subunit